MTTKVTSSNSITVKSDLAWIKFSLVQEKTLTHDEIIGGTRNSLALIAQPNGYRTEQTVSLNNQLALLENYFYCPLAPIERMLRTINLTSYGLSTRTIIFGAPSGVEKNVIEHTYEKLVNELATALSKLLKSRLGLDIAPITTKIYPNGIALFNGESSVCGHFLNCTFDELRIWPEGNTSNINFKFLNGEDQ